MNIAHTHKKHFVRVYMRKMTGCICTVRIKEKRIPKKSRQYEVILFLFFVNIYRAIR